MKNTAHGHPSVPRWQRRVAQIYVWLTGWRLEGALPPVPKFVAIMGPHTSNWDLPIYLILSSVLNIKGIFMAKHSLFIGPFRWFFEYFGGLAIDRRGSRGYVELAVEEFSRREKLALALAPGATRAYRDHWKSGFYHIALRAEVPILMCGLDFERKTGVIAPIYYPAGDPEADLAVIRDFYAGITPKHPERRSRIRFKNPEEDGTVCTGAGLKKAGDADIERAV
jgi:1-acyl-sn-glycerol-3-phosphate acyltransferase